METVFMFSGQGSHYRHMGRELFEQDPVYRDELERLDVLAIGLTGLSVVKDLYDPSRTKSDEFKHTLITHPAIYMVQWALAHSLGARGIKPDRVLGASLGTYVAAAVAGCVSVDDGLRYVVRQSKIISSTCRPGGMLAVLADPQMYERDEALQEHTELAGINFGSHFVLSANNAGLDEAERILRGRGITYQRLAVEYAYHSKEMEQANAQLTAAAKLDFKAARIPLVCCARASTVDGLSAESTWKILRGPIKFRDTIDKLEGLGKRHFVDVGPSGTLATFTKYNLKPNSESRVSSIMTPFGREIRNLERLCA